MAEGGGAKQTGFSSSRGCRTPGSENFDAGLRPLRREKSPTAENCAARPTRARRSSCGFVSPCPGFGTSENVGIDRDERGRLIGLWNGPRTAWLQLAMGGKATVPISFSGMAAKASGSACNSGVSALDCLSSFSGLSSLVASLALIILPVPNSLSSQRRLLLQRAGCKGRILFQVPAH